MDKNSSGKSKYDLAIKIIDDFELQYECKKAAGYTKNQRGFWVPQDISTTDKALSLYLERVKKILEAI